MRKKWNEKGIIKTKKQAIVLKRWNFFSGRNVLKLKRKLCILINFESKLMKEVCFSCWVENKMKVEGNV